MYNKKQIIMAMIFGAGVIFYLIWMGYLVAGLLMLAKIVEVSNYWGYFFLYLGGTLICFSIIGAWIYKRER